MGTQQENTAQLASDLFHKWNDTLLGKDAHLVAELYTQDASFLPTLSGDFKQGREGAEEYFEHFLQKDPKGTVTERQARAIGTDALMDSGMYTFEVGPADKRSQVKARFTFIWERQTNGQWKIAHHHSSLRPE